MAVATRPGVGGKDEIEAADDFVIASQTQINSATFTGLLTNGLATLGEVLVKIYRVFPSNSTNPLSGNVPTRVNSPSDVAFASRDSVAGTLSFSTSTLVPNFTAINSVLSGINPIPNQTTGGEGPVTGGEFYWLSSVRPIVSPGTPFAPDLHAWVRNANLDPDWLRVGTDIVGGATPPTFNEAFTLTGQTVAVSEPASLSLFVIAILGLLGFSGLRRARARGA
jgi:hypothetical protein